MMRVGIAADHQGIALKEQLATALKAAGYEWWILAHAI